MKLFSPLFALLLVVANISHAQFHSNGIFKQTLSLPAQMVVTGTAPSAAVFQSTNVIWKVKVSLPAAMVVTSTTAAFDVIVKKTLNGNDIVNLALGRPLGTKVDAKKEVLALDVMLGTGTGGQFPVSQLIIYNTDETANPLKNETGIAKVLAQNSTLDWQTAYGKTVNAGFGLTSGTLSTSGTAQNGLFDSSLRGGGSSSYKHSSPESAVSASGGMFIEGQLNFVYTDSKGTHTINGLVQHGTATLSGKPLGLYSTPGFTVLSGTEGTIVKKKVVGNDIVNLALGRALGTKVDTVTEVLALNATYETHGQTPKSELVIYDKSQNGAAGITKVLAEYGTLDWQNAYFNSTNSGFGVSTGKLKTSGTAQNGLSDSDFQGGGSAKGKHLFNVGDEHASPVASAFLQGKLKFVYTDSDGTHNFDGIYIKGTGKVSGKPIGGYDAP